MSRRALSATTLVLLLVISGLLLGFGTVANGWAAKTTTTGATFIGIGIPVALVSVVLAIFALFSWRRLGRQIGKYHG